MAAKSWAQCLLLLEPSLTNYSRKLLLKGTTCWSLQKIRPSLLTFECCQTWCLERKAYSWYPCLFSSHSNLYFPFSQVWKIFFTNGKISYFLWTVPILKIIICKNNNKLWLPVEANSFKRPLIRDGAQDILPPNVASWPIEYFKLKVLEKMAEAVRSLWPPCPFASLSWSRS